MSENSIFILGLQIFISAFVVPMWLEIRKLNKEINRLNLEMGRLDTRLEDCLKNRESAAAWQRDQQDRRNAIEDSKIDGIAD